MPTSTFNYTGSAQSFVVPAGVTSIDVTLKGAQGGGVGGNPGNGGLGGQTTGSIPVTPGETLTILVAGQGQTGNDVNTWRVGGGWPGGGLGGAGDGGAYGGYLQGGGGGGLSAIQRGSTYLAIAAGGGGSGDGSNIGGVGGGTTGGNPSAGPGLGGGPGTQSSGGALFGVYGGTAGSQYTGGDGGYDHGGGGGGAGYYGGGGSGFYRGGGGGSALVPSGGSTSSGTNSGNGQVVITYNRAPNTPTNNSPTGDQPRALTLTATGTDPDGDNVYAQFQISMDSSFSTITGTGAGTFNGGTVASGGTSTYALSGLAANAQYYSRARLVDSNGAVSAWTGASAFFTNRTPSVPTLGAVSSVQPTSAILSATVSDPDGDNVYATFQVALASDTSFASPVFTGQGSTVASGASSTVTATGLARNTRYIFRATASDGNRTSAYSAASSAFSSAGGLNMIV